MSDTISNKLSQIQSELVAPKNQRNNFGNYNYRSCEDIVEAVKPLLRKHELVLLISDEMVGVGDRIYVKATATIKDAENALFVTAYAREPKEQKGMQEPQITGSASSYARKYALNGLFAIDDTKDADATNQHGKGEPEKKELDPIIPKPVLLTCDELLAKIEESKAVPHLKNIWTKYAIDIKLLSEVDRHKVKTAKEVKKAVLVGAI